MHKILIVDDEEKIRALIKKYAVFEEYDVYEAGDGMEAVSICRKQEFDVIIMDVMMPELDGFSACREIRKFSDTPVIMLSARGEEYDKIHGFELGVDDYVVKPFSPRELMLRVNAVLRRAAVSQKKDSAIQETSDNDIFVFEGLSVNFTARIVTVDGVRANLSPKEYDLLFYMVRNRNIALSRDKLLNEVWGYDFFGDDRTLDTHIKLLRRSLGAYADLIVTLRGLDTGLKHNKMKISVRIFLYFCIFSLIIIAILWLFQSVFLDDFYKAIKNSDIRSATQELAENYNRASDKTEYINSVALERDVCIMVITQDGILLQDADVQRDCIIHKTSNDPRSRLALFWVAKMNGGEYREIYQINGFAGPLQSGEEDKRKEDSAESVIYVRIITAEDGSELGIITNTTVSPLTSTVKTLNIQLICITGFMLVLSLVLAIVISKHISRPIVKINEAAKVLARGNYDIRFSTSGDKEIAELGNTLNYTAHELSRVDQLQKDLIANISHDMRTPLTMITGYGEVMRDLPGENTPENIQIIIDEADRLTMLVNDALDISKLQSGNLTLETKTFNLTESIRKTILRYQKLIERNGYSLDFLYDTDVSVCADQVKIMQVVYNLMANAINYTGDNQKVVVRQTVHDNVVRIAFEDFGDGIPKEQFRNIWERYYKIDKTHKRATIGTGLGLSIVRTVLELHNAKYGVKSTVGKGSTFWFELQII